MRRPTLVDPPSADDPLVTLDQAKLHLRVDASEEDALIRSFIDGATSLLDGYGGLLGRALVDQVWQQDFDCFDRCLRLPLPASEVVSIDWQATDGTPATVDPDQYDLLADDRGWFVRFKDGYSLPTAIDPAAGVSVTFAAGYGTASDVPAAIRTAVLLLVAHWYLNREAVSTAPAQQLPLSVEALINPFRRMSV